MFLREVAFELRGESRHDIHDVLLDSRSLASDVPRCRTGRVSIYTQRSDVANTCHAAVVPPWCRLVYKLLVQKKLFLTTPMKSYKKRGKAWERCYDVPEMLV